MALIAVLSPITELKHDTASAATINHTATQDPLGLNKQQMLALKLLS